MSITGDGNLRVLVLKHTPAEGGLEELFSAVLERFLHPIQALSV
jgi:hypothetical protein